MKIEFGLLSVISLVYLLLFGIASTEISLDSIEIGITASASSFSVNIHPVWAIWVPQIVARNRGGNAFAFGNVMMFGEHMRGGVHEEYVFSHERMHAQQFRALGLLTWPAQFILNIEPDKGIVTNWNDPTQSGKTMWKAPEGWENQWLFLSISKSGEPNNNIVYLNPNASGGICSPSNYPSI